jgi:hypothetical protein
MVSLLFHGATKSDLETLRERLKQAAKDEIGPPWSCREEILDSGGFKVTFIAAPVSVRATPLEGSADEIIAEFKRRLKR